MGDVKKKKVLMVCLGNSCRSPIAEAVFQDTVDKAGVSSEWEIDSAATESWNIGRSPDYRALKIMSNHGLFYTNKGRQIEKQDFENFDYIFGMDTENIQDLTSLKPANAKAKILLLGDFDPENDRIIRDPNYDSGSEGFEKCYQQCVRSCKGFLDKVKNKEVY